MSVFEITGGNKLKGTVIPQGAKNEALQIVCAVLLTAEPVTITNIPEIVDVLKLIDLLGDMGVKVEKLAKGEYRFQADNVNLEYLKTADYKKKAASLRGSIMVVGPLLARYGKGYIPKPGGDKIGRRRLDTHFLGFQNLGAKFHYDAGDSFYSVEASELKGTYMLLDEASVTGTANIVMAACMAEGTTTIYNAACEPYLQQLCNMINRMVGKISGIGSNMLIIGGVSILGGCEHRCLPDMIE
ncbi:MAG: UDP-N-acetylglucosamine 1-carboxyvinyltransferase, partial [Flavobacteriales bacterium]